MPVRVLIADDDAGVREYLSEILSAAGYTLLTAANGREALDRLRESAVDLVIVDARMPELDGLETLRRLRQRDPTLPVIAISGAGPQLRVREWEQLGAATVLRKPFAPEILEAAIRSALSMAGPSDQK